MGGFNTMRAARAIVVASGLTVLLGLVAVASQSGFGKTGRHAQVSHALISYGLTVFLILFVACIPIAIYLRIQQFDPDSAAAGRGLRRYVRGIVGIGFAFAFAYLLHLLWPHLHMRHSPAHAAHAPQTGKSPSKLHSAAKQSSPTFEWPVLWATIVFVLVAVAVGVMRARMRPLVPLRELPFEEDVAATIESAIDDLEREPDARRAVIAAYARMEGVLGRHGLARRFSETPIEYLRRVLSRVTAHGEAVTRLTTLFERAKFSSHEIAGDAKHDAIAALREIREGMA